MDLPVLPPCEPMLAKPVGAIPDGDYLFEPKWDGFRSIVFRDGDEIEIGSRNERPMTRYFPELVEAFSANLPPRCVIDGEIVLPDFGAGRLDFEALQLRLHPAASRVRMLAEKTPAHFVAFDLLALDSEDYTARPFAERRAALERALSTAMPPVHLTPVTADKSVAERWFSQFEGAGLDGLVAKSAAGVYEPDKRVMLKIKHERTADCVVAGYRPHKTGDDAIGSLLLGLYRPASELRSPGRTLPLSPSDVQLASVGVIGAFPMKVRRELRRELEPLVTTFDNHPWNWAEPAEGVRTPRSSEYSRWNVGKDLSFVPLRPERVVEVRYDHMEGTRFRHTAQFVRWRPDRSPSSCTFAQLEEPVGFDLSKILHHNPLSRTPVSSWAYRLTYGGPEAGYRGRRARGEREQSGEDILPAHRAHQAGPHPVLHGRCRGDAARRGRPADGAQAVRQRGGGRAVLPETRPGETAGLDRDGGVAVSLGPDG
jgi:ATP-dependent DNA ligase